MAKASKWFTEVFLPSFDPKMNNPKYPNRCILSEKQADVCHKYMTAKPCHSVYGKWYNLYEAETETARYTMYKAGRYTFLLKDVKIIVTITYEKTGNGFDVMKNGEKIAEIRIAEKSYQLWDDVSSEDMELWDEYKTLEEVKQECARMYR